MDPLIVNQPVYMIVRLPNRLDHVLLPDIRVKTTVRIVFFLLSPHLTLRQRRGMLHQHLHIPLLILIINFHPVIHRTIGLIVLLIMVHRLRVHRTAAIVRHPRVTVVNNNKRNTIVVTAVTVIHRRIPVAIVRDQRQIVPNRKENHVHHVILITRITDGTVLISSDIRTVPHIYMYVLHVVNKFVTYVMVHGPARKVVHFFVDREAMDAPLISLVPCAKSVLMKNIVPYAIVIAVPLIYPKTIP